jgi:hypothetical protein
MSTSPNEHRHHQRILFDSAASLLFGDKTWQTKIIDISLKGALIQCPSDWNGKIGDKMTLQVHLDLDDRTNIYMHVRVAHVENQHIGFHCDDIDIDSITHLRRLVELNLGDEELLSRELSHLND